MAQRPPGPEPAELDQKIRDELQSHLSAHRELGSEYEEGIFESLLQQIGDALNPWRQ